MMIGAPTGAQADEPRDPVRDSLRYLRETGRADYPFVGTTKAMTIAINTRFLADQKRHAGNGRGWACEMGFATTLIVSWRCQDDEAHRGQDPAIHALYEIVDDTLRPVRFDDVIPPRADRDARLARLAGRVGKQDSAEWPEVACTMPATRAVIYAMPSWGVQILERADSPSGCFFQHKEIVSVLAPQSRLGIVVDTWANGPWNTLQIEPRVLEIDEPGYIQPVNIPRGKTLPDRFVVVDADSVRDTGTGLIWAARDNGADIDADGALAYAKAYRGGGHADWRLPTPHELILLVTYDLAHREPRDCTGGKSNYYITPLIKLSCGILWSSHGDHVNGIAYGFISGNRREVKRSSTKNYRALPVRRP